MRFLNSRVIYAGFFINILIVVLVAFAAFKHFQSNNETLRVIKHRMAFSNELRRLSSLVAQQESEVKSYVITRDEKYISRLNKLVFETGKSLASLNFLNFYKEEDLQKLRQLENSITERSEFHNRLIDKIKYQNAESTDSIIKRAENKFLSNDIDKLTSQLATSVEIYLDNLSQRNEVRKKEYRLVFVITLIICAILLMVVLFILRYYLKTKIESEQRLEEALRKLQESEEEISLLLENIGDGVIATDKNQIITYLNPVAEKLTGWSKDEARGQRVEKVFTIINSETREKVENPIAKAIEQKEIITLERGTILVRKDKSEIMIDDSGSPVFNRQNEVTGAVLIFRDVTIESQAEREIEESNKRFSRILNFTPVAIAITEQKTGNFIFVNDVFCKMLGYTHEELIGKSANELKMIEVEDRERLVKEFVLSGGHGKDIEMSLKRKDGSFVNALYSVESIEISGIPCLAVAIVDVTDKKRAEVRTAVILENIGEGVIVANQNQKILLSNQIAEEILGIDDDYYNSDWTHRYDIFYPDGRTVFPSQNLPLERAFRGEEVHDLEIVLQHRETKKRMLLRVSGKPIIGEDNRLLAAVATLKDITKLRETQRALKETEMKYRKLIGFDREK